MALRYGKSEVTAIEDVLNGDYATVTDAAKAALAAMEDIFEKRARFVVVGQLSGNKERRHVPPSDPEAIKLSLGWHSTEGDARSAAESLWSSTASGDTFRVWVLPTFHGTAAELHGKRKEEYEKAAEKSKQAQRDRIHAGIAKREREAAVRASGGKGACQCGHQPYDHLRDGSSRGKCAFKECACTKFQERKN